MSANSAKKDVVARTQGEIVADEPMSTATSEPASLLLVIERASRDSTVDIEKLERLLTMYERHASKQAETAFYAALSAMQPELPIITERGQIRNKAGGIQSTYALWEDINEAIKPVLKRFGFALSFVTDTKAGVSVTGVLSHSAGHSIRTEILLPADVSGSKNNVQAVASSISYGKRYAAGALLNLTSRGEDDDGNLGQRPGEQDQSKTSQFYSQASFDANFDDWRIRIENKKQTPERIAQLIASKGCPFSDEQMQKLKNIKVPQ